MKEQPTPGPWMADIRKAEKLNQHRYSVPVYSGGVLVARVFGPTMEIAITNAEFIARAAARETEREGL